MGAWSMDVFGNDMACDWIMEFLENPSTDRLGQEIDQFLANDGHLDSNSACSCLVACEALARLRGHWGLRNEYSEDLDDWIQRNPSSIPSSMLERGRKAISLILGDQSELKELWYGDEEWMALITDLSDRLR